MKMRNGASKRTLLAGVSVVAALASVSVANAACTADGQGGFTCSGDNQTINIISDNPVTIAEGANVTGSGLSAIYLNTRAARLQVDGSISATGAAGLTVQNGERVFNLDPYAGAAPLRPYVFPYYYPAGRAQIIIGETGKISGDTGIWIERSFFNYLGDSTATIDNSGVITATSGSAIRGPATNGVAYTSIVNRASGTIDGIAANVGGIDNAGLIDGRDAAAVTIYSRVDPFFGGQTSASITNSGTITSAASVTIVNLGGLLVVSNSGTIVNTGRGRAIDVATSLSLVNSGTITGDIVTRTGSSIDSSRGTINGNVQFGDGDDTLYAAIDDKGALVTGISGQVDGGGGTNIMAFTVAKDSSLSVAPVLPTSFSQLTASLTDNATLTLDASFAATSTLSARGQGTLVNLGRFDTRDTALRISSGSTIDRLRGTNKGIITAALNGSGAAVIVNDASLINEGVINASGGAAVALVDGSRPTAVNSGTISATGSPAILLGGGYSSSVSLENKAGGMIKGDTIAIAIRPASSPWSYNATSITNAGSIVGDVDLRGGASADRFIMQQGGSVTGNILLGEGNDVYAFDGVMGAAGFATGVSGVLDGGEGTDRLLARIGQDSAVKLGNYVNFETVAFEVAKDKTLTLTGDTAGAQLNLYGEGTVDLSLPIAGRNATLINAAIYTIDWPGANYSYAATGTTIINCGTLAATFDSNAYSGSAISLDQLDRFTNEGSISLDQSSSQYWSRASAIIGGQEVINNGTITLNGGNAISSALTVVNTGSIVQTGSTLATGIASVRDLTNSGIIRVGGEAVSASDYTSAVVRNSGTIESQSAQAIRGGYAPVVIVNDATGTITGGAGREAITLYGGGALSNAGMINGTVNLAYSPYGPGYYAGAYVDHGGTLNGDLIFGAGNDIFVATSDTLGVTGQIDAGDGIDTFIRSYSVSRTVDLTAPAALPTGFERRGVGASGKTTVVTIAATTTPVMQPLTLVGDGSIINLADFSSRAFEPVLTLGSTIDPRNLSGAGSTLSFVNRATIRGSVSGYASSFVNEGTISSSLRGATAVQMAASDEARFAFSNSGTISTIDTSPGFNTATGVLINGSSDSRMIDTVTISNKGVIRGGLSATLYAKDVSFSNDGVIERGNVYQASVSLNVGQSYNAIRDVNADRVTIVNTGTLSNGLFAGAMSKAVSFSNSGTINSNYGGGTISVDQYAHYTWDQKQGLYGSIDQESLSFANSGTLNGHASLSSAATAITVANSGTIDASTKGLSGVTDNAALSLETSSLGSQTIAFTNSGRIVTDRLGAGAVVIESSARSAEQRMNGYEDGAVPIAGAPTSTITVTNSGTLGANGGATYNPAIPAPYPWYPSIPESLNLVAGLSIHASSGGLSSIAVTNAAGGVISATAPTLNSADMTPAVGLETIGSTAFVASANEISLINAGTIQGLAGGSVPTGMAAQLPGSDADFAGKFLAGAIQTIGSVDRITNLSTGVIIGSVDLGAFDDQMANYGRIDGNVYLGEGNDSFTHGIRATQNGMVDGGAGTNALTIDITGGGLLDQTVLNKFVNFESPSITGAGTITTSGALAIDSLILRDAKLTLGAGQTLQTASDTSIVFASGTNILTNLGTIKGGLSFAGGTNSVVNRGSIAGPINLGNGNSEFTIAAGSSVSGPVVAGGADDLLILAAGGTDINPQEIRLAGFTGFERTRQDNGTLALSGDYRTGTLTIAGGRFIGRAGSLVNAGAIVVNQGATFGSAGTVNGNILVQGTLSPGASPGTMTVNGNVALSGSSTSLFEMTPSVSDKLVINGGLTIAQGATLTLTGTRPATSGTYQLVTASNGITGSFTAINKAPTIVGFVRQNSRSIDLISQFTLVSGANGQVTRTVDYLNSLLVAGTATNGILQAAPSLLLADDSVNVAAVSRLNAESYASASQIGIENGLAIAAALRTASTDVQPDDAGLFTFGQGLGGWRRLPGRAQLGTAQANISTYGALAGIGFGSQTASIGAFVGYIDARQQIAALQARTKADGMIAGAIAQAKLDGFTIAASVSHDASKADTNRTLLNGDRLSSHYRLRSWTADLSIGHAFDLPDGMMLQPEIGFTHISSRRGDALETGNVAWALDVDGRRTKANFLRGAVQLRSNTEAMVSPWLSAGVLHQLSGRSPMATASYVGVPSGFTINGAGRSDTLATVGAGVNVRLSPTGTLFLGANSEFGAQSSGQGATVGYRIRF